MEEIKIHLTEKEIPEQWYNIQADLPRPLPPMMSPVTKKPATPPELTPLFPEALIMQEVSKERWIDIPEELRDLIRQNRPTPLYRARSLEKLLDTPAKIYYKYEGVNASGSHKLNTALAQAWYNKQEDVKRLATETGAGQWGSALSMACAILNMKCTVYMVKVSYQQKPYRKSLMQLFGAEVFASPTNRTNAGRSILAENPDSLGSLGIAISEAVEDAATHDDTKYTLGSVLNHVLMHQTLIGLEAKKQLEKAGDYPDIVIGCVGGGSNFGGIANPFLMDKLQGLRKNLRVIAVEPAACPSLTKGVYAYDYGDSTGLGPIAKMYTLGHTFMPAGIHAGGLRYHGMSPIVSMLYNEKIIEAVSYLQNPVFEAAVMFARSESIVPAPESAHAIRAAIDEALKAKAAGEKKVILFNLSGHGHFDMAAYDNYLSGNLVDFAYPTEKVHEALSHLPKI
ncbi:MAG: TrpB-like pyridoxal phosphate-dependent enzyme [Elusimicrobia bacterium]|nr:TrpB-like pyridoxal phosphate-dependent enzyme [Elusimicrobiota bacterium]